MGTPARTLQIGGRQAAAFLAPRLPASLVPRPQLLQRFGVERGAAWTSVVGPAGSGKTTAVRAWLEHQPRSWAWIALSPPRHRRFGLAERMVLAAQAARPSTTLDVVDDVGDDAVDDAMLVDRLTDELAAMDTEPVVLAIDDTHLLSTDEWELLRRCIVQLPPSLHLVVIGRREPPIPLGRERATGRLVTLRPDDLVFDRGETTRLLELVAGTSSEDAVESLQDMTEGWAAGVRLAAIAIRDGSSVAGLMERFGRRTSPIAEFLIEEVLDHVPDDRRDVLRRLSLLRLLDPPLCNAVTGRDDVGDVLRAAAADGSFIVAVEGPEELYRFHPLLGSLLRNEIEDVDADAARDVHRSAAAWLQDHDRSIEAIEHLLAAGEHQRAHDLVLAFFRPLYVGTHRSDIDRWLTAVPDGVIVEVPERALEHCVALALVAHDDAGRWWQYCAEHLPDDDWMTSRMDAVRALGLIVDGRLAEARECWRRSRRRRPADRTEPIEEVLQSWEIRLGAMFEDPVAAVAIARRFQRSSREMVTDAPAMSVLAGALAAAGETESAHAIAEQAVEMWRAQGEPGLPGMLDALVVAAAAARQRGDLDAAADHLEAALDVVPHWAPGPNALTMIPLVEWARLARARGDESWRTQLLGLAERLRTAQRPPEVAAWVDRARAELEASVDPSHPARPANAVVAVESPLTERERTVLQLLASHLTLPEIGAELYISRHTVKSHVRNIYRKLDATSRSAAVRSAVDQGILR